MTKHVINTYNLLEVGSVTSGTILNETKHEMTISIRVLREITQEEYLELLSQSYFHDYVADFTPHPELRFYEVEALPD